LERREERSPLGQQGSTDQHPQELQKCQIGPNWETFGQCDQNFHGMIDGGNGLTSWFCFVWQNKLTMFWAHCPINPLDQLAESKVLLIC
jgi:hypothetical protein